MPSTSSQKTTCQFILTDVDKRRLLRFAPQFGITVTELPGGSFRLDTGVRNGKTVEIDLPQDLAYFRILLEVSSRAARWLFFHQGEHCGQTLLGLADAKITRVAELYRLWVKSGSPA